MGEWKDVYERYAVSQIPERCDDLSAIASFDLSAFMWDLRKASVSTRGQHAYNITLRDIRDMEILPAMRKYTRLRDDAAPSFSMTCHRDLPKPIKMTYSNGMPMPERA